MLLEMQARADVGYFLAVCAGRYDGEQVARLTAGVQRAYRWQYILSGAQHEHFLKVLSGMITDAQMQRCKVIIAKPS